MRLKKKKITELSIALQRAQLPKQIILLEIKYIVSFYIFFIKPRKPRWVWIECHFKKWDLVLKGLGATGLDKRRHYHKALGQGSICPKLSLAERDI